MTRIAKNVLLSGLVALLAGCSGAGSALVPLTPDAASNAGTGNADTAASFAPRRMARELGERSVIAQRGQVINACSVSGDVHRASCLAKIRYVSLISSAISVVNGLGPSDLSSIYGFTLGQAAATSAVVGIVVAYDNPNAESDLAAYRAHYGLPACTSANGCFRKVGAASSSVATTAGAPTSISAHPTSISATPTNNVAGWAAESDADMDAVSAVCATCKIVLAEAASDQMSDLGNAVGAAVSAGATVVNASFGAPESTATKALESQFEPAPVKVVAAAGDNGPQALFPAAATNVISVSGTSLNVLGILVTDSLWSGSGGGCSAIFAKPSFQPGWCGSKRSIADVAAVADPSDGIAFYDSALGGWGIVGGTSIATPIVSSMFALSGYALKGTGAQQLYGHLGYAPVLNGGTIAGLGTPLSLAAF
jgi:hypothetical protein